MDNVIAGISTIAAFATVVVLIWIFGMRLIDADGRLTFWQLVTGKDKPCHKCKKILKKADMIPIQIPDGIMDDRRVWFCKSCETEYLNRIARGNGPFSAMARYASGRFAE